MSIWTRLGEFLQEIAADTYNGVVEALRTVFEGDPIARKQVGFSVAMIALSAKMAKADGIVTRDEVDAFRQIFHIPENELHNVSRLYNLAKQDVAGFDLYAARIARLFEGDEAILTDVMDGLFHIAKADGLLHENEMAFMDTVSEIFGLEGRIYEQIKARHLEPEGGDPYRKLGAERDWSDEQLKRHYRALVKEHHPDQMIARGIPQEFIALATERLAEINKSWEAISLERGL